jgi:hypothetical protein
MLYHISTRIKESVGTSITRTTDKEGGEKHEPNNSNNHSYYDRNRWWWVMSGLG